MEYIIPENRGRQPGCASGPAASDEREHFFSQVLASGPPARWRRLTGTLVEVKAVETSAARQITEEFQPAPPRRLPTQQRVKRLVV
jgi:hypothetical protein